jgi:hypothetical protein
MINNNEANTALINNIDDITENLETLSRYLNSEIDEEREFAQALMEGGFSYVVFELPNGERLFGPSRFLGYKENNKSNHQKLVKYKLANGKDTNPAIDKAVKEYTNGIVKGYIESQKYEDLLIQSYPDFEFHNNKKHFWIVSYDVKDVKNTKKLKYIQNNMRDANCTKTVAQSTKVYIKYHVTLESDFRKYLDGKGIKSYKETSNFADFVYEANDIVYLVELKPYTSQSVYQYNLQGAVGQVLRYKIEYRKLNKENKPVKLQIVMKGYKGVSIARLSEFEMEIESLGIEIIHL